jgi:hypothetical protein
MEDVTQARQSVLDRLEALTGNKDIDVLGKPAESMLEHRHSTGNGIGYSKLVEATCDFSQGLEDRVVPLEVAVAFVHRPPSIFI